MLRTQDFARGILCVESLDGLTYEGLIFEILGARAQLGLFTERTDRV